MEGLDKKVQNSGLQYSNVSAIRIRSAMCLSKTSVYYSSTSCAPDYVTVYNYEENFEVLCLNRNTYHLRLYHSSVIAFPRRRSEFVLRLVHVDLRYKKWLRYRLLSGNFGIFTAIISPLSKCAAGGEHKEVTIKLPYISWVLCLQCNCVPWAAEFDPVIHESRNQKWQGWNLLLFHIKIHKVLEIQLVRLVLTSWGLKELYKLMVQNNMQIWTDEVWQE